MWQFIISTIITINSLAFTAKDNLTVIVEKTVPKANIVVKKGSAEEVKRAALTLQDYIFKSTGAKLQVTENSTSNKYSIFIGDTKIADKHGIKYSTLDQDGFVIKSLDNGDLLILGGTVSGTEIGVYHFLETIVGVKWLMPTELGTIIPDKESIVVPGIEIRENPVYKSRALSPINVNEDTDLGRWGRYNRLKNNVSFHHNLNNIFKVEELVKVHPDYLPTISSRRIIPSPGSFDWQPNFTAPGISDYAAVKILREFQKNPSMSSYSLGINDSKKFDQSKRSKGVRRKDLNHLKLEDASNDYYLWANAVAKKVNAVYPHKKFGTLAYNNVISPPSTSIGVHPNIIPYITNERSRWSSPSFQQLEKRLTVEWAKQANSVGWYDYTYGSIYLFPRVWFNSIGDYLRWGAKNNVNHYYAEFYPNWGEGPKGWLLSKLLWNPEQNVDELLNVWYTSFAGRGGGVKLREFYTLWEDFWEKEIPNTSWYDVERQFLDFNDVRYAKSISHNMIKRSRTLLNEALSLAETSSQKKRVSKILQVWEIYELSINEIKSKDLRYIGDLKKSSKLIKNIESLQQDQLHNKTADLLIKFINP